VTSADAGSGLGVGRTVGLGRTVALGCGMAGVVARGSVVDRGVEVSGDDAEAGAVGVVLGEGTGTGVGAAADEGMHAVSSTARSHWAWRAIRVDDGMPPSSHPLDPMRNEPMGLPVPSVK